MTKPNASSRLDSDDQQLLADAQQRINSQLNRLRDVVPVVLDMSFREAALSSRYGHTLEDKKELLRLGKEFGFTDFGLPNFYNFPTVGDQFLDHVLADGSSLDPFYVTVAVEPTEEDTPLPQSPAALRVAEAGIPNVILLVEIRPATLAQIGRSYEQTLSDIERYISHYRTQLPEENERQGRLYVRIADPFDAFDEDAEFVMQVFKLLGSSPITGILFEDVRGSRFTFESNELIRLMRHYNPPPCKILVHPHSGNGLEDAATIEAILAGADGVWSGFTPQAAQGAHGSSMMFLTNLLRAGNQHVRKKFRFDKLTDIARQMWKVLDRQEVEPNQPVVGERAYRYVDYYFEQTDLPRDLDPKDIGCTPGFEIMPAWAPATIIGKRLEELGYDPEITEDQRLLYAMRVLMHQSQIDGKHIRYDDSKELAQLVEQAQQALASSEAPTDQPVESAVLTKRYS